MTLSPIHWVEAATSEALWEMEGQEEQSGAENAGGGAVGCHLTILPLNFVISAAILALLSIH